MIRAKIFKVGDSQEVQLPKEFKLKVKEFYIRKEGANIILTPGKNAVDEFWKSLGKFPKDLMIKRNQTKLFDKCDTL